MMKGFIKAKFHATVGVDGQELMRRLKWLTNCREKKLPYIIKCILGYINIVYVLAYVYECLKMVYFY